MLKNLFKRKKTKVCPRCGKTFTCVVKEGCWCEKFVLSRENLKEIRKDFIDCLCPACLQSYSQKEK